jgi:hypothetical protein
MERFYVVKVDEPINTKNVEANWLVKQHIEELQSFAAHTSKTTYFILTNGDKAIVVSSYGSYAGLEEFAPGKQIRLLDDGNRSTNFGRSLGKEFTIKAITTADKLAAVEPNRKLKFYVCK